MTTQHVRLLLHAVNIFGEKSALSGFMTIVLFWGVIASLQNAIYYSQLLPPGIGMEYDVSLHNKTFIKCLAPFGCNINNVQLLENEQVQLFSLNASVHIVGYYETNATGLHEVASLLAGNALSLPTSHVGLESNITLYRVEFDGDTWRYTTVDRTLDIACDDCISFWLSFSPLANVVYSTKDLNIGIIIGNAAPHAIGAYVVCWLVLFFDRMRKSTAQASLYANAARREIQIEVDDF